MVIHSIPGYLEVKWLDDVRSMLDTWTNYTVTLPQFREAVLEKGVSHAGPRKAIGWIVDSSKAKGAFSQEIQKFIETDIFPAFAGIGVKYFCTINSQASPTTRMTVDRYSAQTGPHGLTLVQADTTTDAIQFLKEKLNA